MTGNTDKSVKYQKELEKQFKKYNDLLNKQKFVPAQLDYNKLQHYKDLLTYLDAFESNAYEIFDLYKKEHIYFSNKFLPLLGYDLENMQKNDAETFFDSKIHKDDYLKMTEVGNYFFALMLKSKKEEVEHSKLIFDFRILNASNQYVRIIKQFKVLEFDKFDNAWLSMGIINLSPEQNMDLPLKSKLVNTMTGETYYFKDNNTKDVRKHPLTDREIEILELISNGKTSKEIAGKLFLSANTINTHRQRIIEKLNVKNTAEAIRLVI